MASLQHESKTPALQDSRNPLPKKQMHVLLSASSSARDVGITRSQKTQHDTTITEKKKIMATETVVQQKKGLKRNRERSRDTLQLVAHTLALNPRASDTDGVGEESDDREFQGDSTPKRPAKKVQKTNSNAKEVAPASMSAITVDDMKKPVARRVR